MHCIFNHKWIVDVLWKSCGMDCGSPQWIVEVLLPGVVVVMVSVLLGVIGEVMVHVG